MAAESYLTVGEFERSTRQQTSILLAELRDIKRVQMDHGSRLSSVETVVKERTTAKSEDDLAERKKMRNAAAGWSTAAAGLVVVVIEGVKAWMKP